MAIMIYQHRTLVSTAGYDQVSGRWKYAATIGWSEFGSITRFQCRHVAGVIQWLKTQRRPDWKLLNPG
jgi:hypothetical protein